MVVVFVELPELRRMILRQQRKERSDLVDLIILIGVKILVEILLLEVSRVVKIEVLQVLLVAAKRRHLVDRPLVFPHVGNEFSHLQIPKRPI